MEIDPSTGAYYWASYTSQAYEAGPEPQELEEPPEVSDPALEAVHDPSAPQPTDPALVEELPPATPPAASEYRNFEHGGSIVDEVV